MTHAISLTDGTTTLDLVGGDYIFRDWTPQEARLSRDALSILDPEAYDDVTETLYLRVHEATDWLAAQQHVRAIERILQVAQARSLTGGGTDVYLEVALIGDNTWRTEVLGGSVAVGQDAIASGPANKGADITVTVRRKFYWETLAETPLTLQSSSGINTSVTITNDHDENWIKLYNPSENDGSLPSPVKIKLQNASGSMLGTHRFFISNNVFNSPATIDPYLTSTDLDVGSAAETWANTVHNPQGPEWGWDLTNQLIAACDGGYFRVLAAFSQIDLGQYLKANIYTTISGTNTLIHEGEEIAVPDDQYKLIDLGSVPIPPGRMPNGSSIRIGISTRGTGGGTIDFIQLMPTTSYRRLVKPAHSWANGGHIVDNGLDGTVYMGSDTLRSPVLYSYGKPIFIWPERENRLDILYSYLTNIPANDAIVSMWTRPRRSTL